MLDILNSLLPGLIMILKPATLGLMLLGILIGFCVGILPGIGGPTALALMLAFVTKMDAAEAFAFLLGMAAVTTSTGEITSVLFGVPGEPTTATTILDGHPMAKKGEAGRALGVALMASLLGAIIGALSLGLAIPVVRPLVMSFGSPEFFMMAILGLTFVSALSGEAVLRGLISGGMGLFLATVGLDPISGIQRYTFGQLFLWDGIGLVPITVGFFAIPEIIDLAVQGTSIAGKHEVKLDGIMEGVKDTWRNWWLLVRCSVLGTFVGIMPGIGAATSQWLAYAHAVQSSPNKEQFGKGCVEGVLAPSSADSSTLGGALIPTVAFGIPGSVMMAILLGAFLIQGLVPGPDMLIPEAKGGHLSLTFSFMWTVIVSTAITTVVCLLFLKQLVKITAVRGGLLVPFILVLIYLGAFAEKNSFPDIPLVLLFGFLGWVMVKLRWPRPPVILGLVLGPLAEGRLFLSVDNYGYAWLGRPIVLVIILLTVSVILYPILKRVIGGKRRRPSEMETEKSAGSERRTPWNGETIFAFVIVFIFMAALLQSRNFTLRPGLFPWVIGFPILFLSLAELILCLSGRYYAVAAEDESIELPAALIRKRTIQIYMWILFFFFAIWSLGFVWGTTAAMLLNLKLSGREKWPITLALTGLNWAFIYIVFHHFLHIPFPPGLIFRWLGLA